MPGRPRTKRAVLVAGLLAALLGVPLALGLVRDGAAITEAAPTAAAKNKRPNIILISTDDQTLSSFTRVVMPKTARLARRGTSFSEAIVTTPLCCPSRATVLTGQYGHNNGILENTPGWPLLRDRANALPNWLRAVGYRTAHVGKWLHGYGKQTEGKNAVAPGWRHWFTFLKLEYYKYRLRVNGRAKRYGKKPKHYLTRVLNKISIRLIRKHVPKRRPLYLQLDHLAPHSGDGRSKHCRRGPVPDPRDDKRFRKAALPTPPNFNEADVSDKPSFVSGWPRLTGTQVKSMRKRYRCALASLRAVDRGVAKIVRAVRKAGEKRNTAIIFTSDNGYFRGEHRMYRGKGLPYEESLRVPMAMLLPPRLAGRSGQDHHVAEPVANVDLAPTILELAGAKPCYRGRCRAMDGRSLVDLARGSTSGWPDGRAIVIEYDKGGGSASSIADTCTYSGLRVPARVFVDHVNLPNPANDFRCEPSPGAEELYDLRADPFQLDNLAVTDPAGTAAERAAWRTRLDELRDCAGIAGRDPAPAGGANCE